MDDLIDLARAVQFLGPKFVLVKGGYSPFKASGTIADAHAERELMIDILYGEGQVTKIETRYRNSNRVFFGMLV